MSALRWFKVVDFGTNRKRVYDFLLVRHSNLGPVLHRFRYIGSVNYCLFNRNFASVIE